MPSHIKSQRESEAEMGEGGGALPRPLYSIFERMIAVMSPEDSWVCKWQRINRFCKGVYAISVSGRLPATVIREMKSRGLVYRPRDTSQR
uniref:(California timema) hypothetical protein n=1 Tax=Timema californicum TaxID=61474 RepID=A0A7R9P8Q3_TIMCA|nr:unnamed protein product [Timema californicum]